MVVRGAEDERRSERLVQTRPEGAREARVAVRYVGQPHVAEHRSFVRGLSHGCLRGRDKPDPASQRVDVHLHEVVVRPGRRELDEVEADAPPAACRHRQEKEEAGRRKVVGFDAFAGRSGPYVLLHRSGQAGPPHGERAPAQGRGMSSCSTCRRSPPCLWNTQPVTARTSKVQHATAANEGAARRRGGAARGTICFDCDRGCRDDSDGAERGVGGKGRPQGRGQVGVKKARGGGSTTDVNEGCGGRCGGRGGEEFQLRVRLIVAGAQRWPGALRKRLRVMKSAGPRLLRPGM